MTLANMVRVLAVWHRLAKRTLLPPRLVVGACVHGHLQIKTSNAEASGRSMAKINLTNTQSQQAIAEANAADTEASEESIRTNADAMQCGVCHKTEVETPQSNCKSNAARACFSHSREPLTTM
jgi:hypothetical protein